MTRSVVRVAKTLTVALCLALIPLAACSRTASRPPTGVAPAHAAADSQPRVIRLAELPRDGVVRYNLGKRWYGLRAGRVRRVSGDTLWVTTGWFQPDRAIPADRLHRLDFNANEKEVGRVLAWGAGVGAAIGVIVGLTLDEPECEPGCVTVDYPGRATTTVLLGTYGAVAGVAGAMFVAPRAKWVKVETSR